MDLLQVINIKNSFQILILKAKEKAKSKAQLQNLEVLSDVLLLLNLFQGKLEEVQKELRETKLNNARKHLEIETLKVEVNKLNTRIKQQNKELKTLLK
tara:strand:+ start:455 stop:748 length:294 start_codon:yes stop_codon:yes gene_type:complete